MKKLFLITLLLVALGGALGSTASAHTARKASTAHQIYTRDFITATVLVGRYYGSNVRWWLVNCSNSEGGHGGWVWYGHHDHPIFGNTTPGGWMQFMETTFYSNVDWAFADAHKRGMKIDPRARSYYEPLGQAVVAGAMYAYHGNPGTWTGAQC